MAEFSILSTAELQTADDGLYYVADDDGKFIETEKDGAVHRLMARVRDEAELPDKMQGVVVRADGKQIITEWVLAANVEAEIPAELEPATESPRCPLCQTALTNPVIQSVTVCPGCGRSIALVGESATLATSTSTLQLSKNDILLLKKQRRQALA